MITQEQTDFLIKNYAAIGRIGCSRILGIPELEVKKAAKLLNIKVNKFNWIKVDEYLIKNYASSDRISCAKELNITISQVKSRVRRLCLKIDLVWTKEETDWLIKNYPFKGLKYCSAYLKKPKTQVKTKIKHLRLRQVKKLPKDGFKFCATCQIEKETSCYTIDNGRKDKLSCYCRDCHSNLHKTEKKSLWKKLNYLKKKKDPLYILTSRYRTKTRKALKGIYKGSCLQYLGCTREFFIEHLKSTMTPNMTWELALNGKLIHIDHIIAIDTFKNLLTSEEERKKCFHYTNLRLLWATTDICKERGDGHLIGNLNKSNKII